MEPDLIDRYVAELHRSLARSRRTADVVAEVEDHLRESVHRFTMQGLDDMTAQRLTLDRFGDLPVVARAFATDAGGLAMQTSFTRAAGAVGHVAVALWLLTGAAHALDAFAVPDSDSGMYVAVSILAALATIATTVVIAGMLVRSGGVRDLVAVVAIAAMVLATLLMALAPWAWVFTAVPLTGAVLIAARRMRAIGLGRRWSDVCLVLAWPAGVLVALVGEVAAIGPRDLYDNYPWAFQAGITVAVVLFATGLTGVSGRLGSEQPVGGPAVGGLSAPTPGR